MPEQNPTSKPAGPVPPAAPKPGLTGYELMAALLSAVWVVAVLAYMFTAPEGRSALGLVMTLLVVFLPLALIWVTVITLRSVRALRDEAARLQAAVDAMRHAYVAGQQAQASGIKPSVEKKLDEIAAVTRQAETVLATFTSRRDAALTVPSADRKAALVAPRAAPVDEQPALALGTPAEDLRPPLSVADFVRALQFPETAEDKEGFRALRLALEDRNVARLIRAAQDVLTLLSQEGIFMDDLKPDLARPEVWRRFAAGERGRAIAALGGVRDRSSLALTAARMKDDPIFRDAAHHFLRTFDKTFSEFEKNATDAEIADLAETRTARAFMLFGRVTGTFD
ncbi:hypothetical protein E7811_09725 [Aliigemmobacter aestuarii]|uniref:Uncharacterized protein n=1 Tax=Aliigemmobacter aestuarii TaxID=1445661 RepID=A0A4V6RS19_9RHOB|nr:hypothetical protein E7811_09725 [Gemmobacter aestuarii]